MLTTLANARDELRRPGSRWLPIDRFDRRAVNRRLAALCPPRPGQGRMKLTVQVVLETDDDQARPWSARCSRLRTRRR